MSGSPAGPEIERLIQLLAKLPGLGPRSARRAALTLLKKREGLLDPLAKAMAEAAAAIKQCDICGNLDTQNPCTICRDTRRDPPSFAWWRTWPICGRWSGRACFKRPLSCAGRRAVGARRRDARAPEFARPSHTHRAGGVAEVILAMNATVEGQTTAHYLMDALEPLGVKITRLAHGVPVGGELDYLDEGTLSAAFKARRPF